MKIVVNNLLSKQLIADGNPHSKEYSLLMADLEAVKILHLLFTFAVPLLLSPRFGEHAHVLRLIFDLAFEYRYLLINWSTSLHAIQIGAVAVRSPRSMFRRSFGWIPFRILPE